jgi:N-acetyl-gamma-glutamyl-phosphate reductase
MTPGPGRANREVGVAVLGASGYTGSELIRLLCEHPQARLTALGSRQHNGRRLGDVLPGLPHIDVPLDDGSDPRAWKERGTEVVFAALPHGAFAARAADFVTAGLRVVDLSADFRLRDPAAYPLRYHFEHPAPQLLAGTTYGLCEWFADAVHDADFVANPGCYATAVLLGVLPAVARGLCSGEPVVVNAVSGVSGAGRAPKLTTHFVECGNSVSPYRVGETHVHLGEILQTIATVAKPAPPSAAQSPVVFNPHLVPMARGILATLAVPLSRPMRERELFEVYAECYAEAPFVHLLGPDQLPETRHVRGSNRCDIAVRAVAGDRMLLVFSAIDNLLKGAAGQAVQNWNLMQGWPQQTGLPMGGWSCA